MERVHLVLADSESILGQIYFNFILLVTLLSCISIMLESEPMFLTYREECKICAPLSGNEYFDISLVAQRAALAETCRTCHPFVNPAFNIVERFSLIVFLVDYGVRFITAHRVPTPEEIEARDSLYLTCVRNHQKLTESSGAHNPEPPLSRVMRRQSYMRTFAPPPPALTPQTMLRRTIRFCVQPLNIADLIAVAPYVLTLANFAFLRVVRLFRALKVLRLNQLSDSLNLFLGVISKSSLDFTVFFIFSGFGMIFFASLAYYAERGEWDPATGEFLRDNLYYLGPKQASPFYSIAQSCWWVLVTFATVGYGDMIPTTHLGRLVAVITMYSGTILMAMPITIMGLNVGHFYLLGKERRKRRARISRTAIQILQNIIRGPGVVPLRRAWNTWREFAQHQVELEEHPGIAIEAELEKLLHLDRSVFMESKADIDTAFSPRPQTEAVFGRQITEDEVNLQLMTRQGSLKGRKIEINTSLRKGSGGSLTGFSVTPPTQTFSNNVVVYPPTDDIHHQLSMEVQSLSETVTALESQIALLASVLQLHTDDPNSDIYS